MCNFSPGHEKYLIAQASFSGVHFFPKTREGNSSKTDTVEFNSGESNSTVAISSQRLEKVTVVAIGKPTTTSKRIAGGDKLSNTDLR
ncbi:hypothetical protein COB52_02885 [Candidatus Kaiserbacteria bacterium]|nr:MAG: hypothetical protein COB52_02885 [Candidatus Kaiserbacteria bacterium]